jgi:hypothetical protein
MARLRFFAFLGVIVATAVASPGCTCSAALTAPSVVGVGGGGGHATGSGEGGFGGEGGGPARGIAAGEVVSAGRLVKSRNYSMVFTLGQPSQNQGKMTSPRYRMQGGLVGANGSLP